MFIIIEIKYFTYVSRSTMLLLSIFKNQISLDVEKTLNNLAQKVYITGMSEKQDNKHLLIHVYYNTNDTLCVCYQHYYVTVIDFFI